MGDSSRKGLHVFEPLTYNMIGACIDVQKQLGLHCMEIDYQRALEIALPKFGVEFEREVDIPIVYEGVVITQRRVDFVCWDKDHRALMETKAASTMHPEDVEQCLLYVGKAGERICLLVNMGEKPIRARRFVNTPKGGVEV